MAVSRRRRDTSRRPALAHAALAGTIVVYSGCSGAEQGSRATHATDARSESAGGAGGADGGESDSATGCTALEVVGSIVIGEYVQGTPPTPVGGSMVDGTYDATAFATYVPSPPPAGTPSPREFRSVLGISGGATRFELVDTAPNQSGGEFFIRESGELILRSPSVLFSWLCPPELVNNRDTWQFSASADELVLFVENNTTTYRRR